MGFYSKHIFPRMMDWALSSPAISRARAATLESARGHVLEIGFGTGLNLPHYPPAVNTLTLIDPNLALADRVARRISKARMPVEQFELDASGRLPFDDSSFDVVATTFTLCSIDDVSSALREMRRVLRPEGQYLFLEHGRSDDPGVAQLQKFLNPVQKLVACGCHLNRPIADLIPASSFCIVELDRFQMTGLPRFVGECYRGIARIGEC